MNGESGHLHGLRPQAPGYWVRRFLSEMDAFVLAPAEGEGKELVASIDPQSPARGRMLEVILGSLYGNRQGSGPVRLLVRPKPNEPERPGRGAEPSVVITDVFPVPFSRDREAREIMGSDGRVISRWSESLAEAVDHHGRLVIARRALEFFERMDADTYDRIRKCAAEGLPENVVAILPGDFEAVLGGKEEGRHCRYNPILPLALQVSGASTASQRANFAIQRAMVKLFAEDAGTSALGDAQEELLSNGVLLAAPIASGAELLRSRSREAALGIGSLVLAGLMDLQGTEPANKDCDELHCPQADGSVGRRRGLHDEVLEEMAPHPIARSADAEKRRAAYLEMALSRLARYGIEAQALVSAEQAKAAVSVSRRSPGIAGASEPARSGMDGVISFGAHVAAAADHVHKVVTQVEVLPWM